MEGKYDAFIHLSWDKTFGASHDDAEVQTRNIQYTLDAVQLAHRCGCTVFVGAGSQAEYGIVPGVITEETPCNPFSAYGKAKLEMYHKSRELAQEMGMKYIHLRILSVYGENDHSDTLIMSSLRKLKANEPIEMRSGGQMCNYVLREGCFKADWRTGSERNGRCTVW